MVIFDLDGTLADTLVDIAASLNACLAARGLPARTKQEIRLMVGDGVEKLVERATATPDAAAPALRRELAASFRAHYAEHLIDGTVPYDQIGELLAELARRAIPTAVCSNKPDPHTRRLIATLFPEHAFTAVEGQRADRPAKPDPTVALAIARDAGEAPKDCLFVGDTATDVETARRAGMIAVGVLWGFRDRQELTDAGAHVLIESPLQLLHHTPPFSSG
jgi:phosphoglycolate phosphatase